MYRRNFWLLVLCTLLAFVFTACPNDTTDEDPENIWSPSTGSLGTFENTNGSYRIVINNGGFIFSNKVYNQWENNRRGWIELNYAGTKMRFNYTDTWSSGAWQSFTLSEVYNHSGYPLNHGFTLSGDVYGGLMKGTWEPKNENVNSKPAKLASTATYQQTVNKLDEIIAYCTNNPGPGNANNSLKSAAETKKSQIATYESTWDTQGSAQILQINIIIDQLQ